MTLHFSYLFAVGGINGSGYVAGVDQYDPGASDWTADVASLPVTGRTNFCAVDVSNVLWILGGTR